MNVFERKTSEEWSKDTRFSDTTVLDPDGWDRQDYQYSWFEEKISAAEYEKRLVDSTILVQRRRY